MYQYQVIGSVLPFRDHLIVNKIVDYGFKVDFNIGLRYRKACRCWLAWEEKIVSEAKRCLSMRLILKI